MLTSLFNRTHENKSLPPIANMTAPELNHRLQSKAPVLMLDVRSPAEFQYDGHIAGARLLPLNVLQQRLNEIPQDRPIVVICRSGNRSLVACEVLISAGFENVTNLGRGMIGWQMAGLPVNK